MTDGKTVDWQRVRWTLPNFLVWGEDWEDLPDRCFVKADEVEDGAREVERQGDGNNEKISSRRKKNQRRIEWMVGFTSSSS